MPLYRTTGIRDSRATLANHGETIVKWSGSYSDSTKDRKHLKGLGFDVTTSKFECPKDKKSLLALLNLVAKN